MNQQPRQLTRRVKIGADGRSHCLKQSLLPRARDQLTAESGSVAQCRNHLATLDLRAEWRIARGLLDPEQKLAKPAGVRTMAASVVLLPDDEVVYRERINDRYTEQGKHRLEPTSQDLKTVIEAVLSGRKPEPAEKKTYGCPLPKVKQEM